MNFSPLGDLLDRGQPAVLDLHDIPVQPVIFEIRNVHAPSRPFSCLFRFIFAGSHDVC